MKLAYNKFVVLVAIVLFAFGMMLIAMVIDVETLSTETTESVTIVDRIVIRNEINYRLSNGMWVASQLTLSVGDEAKLDRMKSRLFGTHSLILRRK